MTTFIDFSPSVNAPFQFQAVLDSATYNVVVTWGLFGQGWYINVSDLSNNLILSRKMTGSVIGNNILSVSWAAGFVNVVTTTPHGYFLNATSNLTISGCEPDAYNGIVPAFINGRNTFAYPLMEDPGPVTMRGIVNYNIDLVAGYFETSTLVFRQARNQFEISP